MRKLMDELRMARYRPTKSVTHCKYFVLSVFNLYLLGKLIEYYEAKWFYYRTVTLGYLWFWGKVENVGFWALQNSWYPSRKSSFTVLSLSLFNNWRRANCQPSTTVIFESIWLPTQSLTVAQSFKSVSNNSRIPTYSLIFCKILCMTANIDRNTNWLLIWIWI